MPATYVDVYLWPTEFCSDLLQLSAREYRILTVLTWGHYEAVDGSSRCLLSVTKFHCSMYLVAGTKASVLKIIDLTYDYTSF